DRERLVETVQDGGAHGGPPRDLRFGGGYTTVARASATRVRPLAMVPSLWSAVFGNHRRVELEIGPGRGEVLLAWAAAAPATNFFAIERSNRATEALRTAAARRRLSNARVVAGDAQCVLAHCVPDESVNAHHVYFPDPWPKTGHR